MIKILILEPTYLSNTGYWRLYRPLEIMRRLYPGVFQLTYKRQEMAYADIMEHDLVITRRPSGSDGAALIKLLKKARSLNRHVIFDEDDAVMQCPRNHELYSTYRTKEVREQYVQALECASQFWFSTPAFLETIHPQGLVIPNAILPSDLPEKPAPDLGLIGWQGKSIQAHDVILAGWDWYNENKGKQRAPSPGNPSHMNTWVFYGWEPPLRHLDNTELIGYMDDVDAYMEAFRTTPINAMWKPLIECAFNNHKSNINWLGITTAGGYCITNYAGKPGWEYASKEILPYNEACELWAASKAHILENYNLLTTARMRAQSIFALVPHFFPEKAEAV